MAAIQASTLCLFDMNDGDGGGSNSNSNSNHDDDGNGGDDDGGHRGRSETQVVDALAYLDVLHAILVAQPSWEVAPSCDPPPFRARNNNNGNGGGGAAPTNRYADDDDGGDGGRHPPAARLLLSSNPYASIYASDEDDDDDDEAGDVPVRAALPRDGGGGGGGARGPTTGELDTLRLLVRLHTSQSDLHARGARLSASGRRWLDGSAELGSAVHAVRVALGLADAEISRYLEADEDAGESGGGGGGGRTPGLLRKRQLEEDADIVHVSTQSVVQERDRYVQAAVRQAARLEAQLRPQWQSRDVARAGMGEQRWIKNPSAKHDHFRARAREEAELKDLRKALEELAATDDDASGLQESARHLRERLQQEARGGGDRYNGLRPDPALPRLGGYPDAAAADYGWTFTGSSGAARVEFFERMFPAPPEAEGVAAAAVAAWTLVKLDFYFTTGTVKTSLDHPRQGRTQLFARQVSPDVYHQILLDPRAHTNVRYQQRTGRKGPGAPRREGRAPRRGGSAGTPNGG